MLMKTRSLPGRASAGRCLFRRITIIVYNPENKMDVDGYYNFILTKASPSRVIPKFLEALAKRWPEMLIRELDYRRLKSFRVYNYNSATSEMLSEEGSILISKDESMEKCSQEMGFRLMESGEAS